MKDEIYSMAPVNKTAALVVNQKNCAKMEELTDKQRYEVIRRRLTYIQKILPEMDKNSKEKKSLGLEYRELALEASSLKERLKLKYNGRELQNFILDIVKEDIGQHEWEKLIKKAKKRMDELGKL